MLPTLGLETTCGCCDARCLLTIHPDNPYILLLNCENCGNVAEIVINQDQREKYRVALLEHGY